MTSENRLQLNASLSALFYVSVCFGAIPYSAMEFRNNKLFKISFVALGFSVANTIFNVTQYHLTTNHFTLSENKDAPTSNLN